MMLVRYEAALAAMAAARTVDEVKDIGNKAAAMAAYARMATGRNRRYGNTGARHAPHWRNDGRAAGNDRSE